ncbi:MAG: radical SAM protein [Candidatus Nealsonbacteria bacterium]
MENHNYKKIILINPPSALETPVLPLGLASIAGYLKSNRFDVSVIDAWAENMELLELKNKVSQSEADIIGVSITTPRYNEAKSTIEICRQALPKAIIIAGGHHPSALPAETLNEIPELDICAIGEGEITMAELIKALQENWQLSRVDGIAYRENNEIRITKSREFIKDLDILPFPARELFPLEKYKPYSPLGKENPSFITITSRGCPFRCTFCSKDVFKQTFRARSAKNVCDEIEELITKYGAREIPFLDDDFTMNMKRAEEICDEIIKRRLKFHWTCQTRVNQINEPLLKKIKKAGCWLIAYGVESGSQKILDSINKDFTVNQVVSAFSMAQRVGLSTGCNIIFGLPGETKETIQDTLNLVKKIKPNVISYGILTVYPGSRLFELIKSGKYPGKLRTLKEGESIPGTFFKGDHIIFEENLTFEQLREIAQKATREFYLRPQYVIQSMKNIRSFSDFKYYFRSGLKVIKSAIG